MGEIKLKPCPFCGGTDTLIIGTCTELEECKYFEACEISAYKTICCNVNKGGCGASCGFDVDESRMIEKWNRRAGEQNEQT